MSDVAAVSAPAAPAAASAPANGATAPAPQTPAAKPANGTAPAKPAAPEKKPLLERTADGRYIARGLKVDGVESDQEFTEDDLRRELQERGAGQKRLKEVAQEKARLQQVLGIIRKDPIGSLSQLGVDTDSALAEYVQRQAHLAALTPEQREVLSARQQAAQYQQQMQQQQAQLQEAQVEQHWRNQWEPELRAAFQEFGWGDDSEGNLVALAELGERYTQAGIDLPPRQLVQLVDNETATTAAKYAGRAPPAKAAAIAAAALPRLTDDALEAVLGPRLEALMQRRVAALKAKRNPANAQPTTERQSIPQPEKKSPLTPEEWRRNFLASK
jgi:hypothetical protein